MLITDKGQIRTQPLVSKTELVERLREKAHARYSTGPERATFNEIINFIKCFEGKEGSTRRVDFTDFIFDGNTRDGSRNVYRCAKCDGTIEFSDPAFCPWCGAVADRTIKNTVIKWNADLKEHCRDWLLRPLTKEQVLSSDGQPLWFEEYHPEDTEDHVNDGFVVVHVIDGEVHDLWHMEDYDRKDVDGWRAWPRKPRPDEKRAAEWEARRE